MSPPSPPEPARFVVIPSFDQHADTTRCLEAILGDSQGSYTVLVVDHGHEAWTIPDYLPTDALRVLRASPDLWWAGATNLGMQHALDRGATSVMLLNADCVLEAASATDLFQRSESSEAIVAPVQVDLASGATTCAGAIPLPLLGFATLYERREVGGFWDRFTIVCGGRGVVIPAPILEKEGLLAADSLPHYWADHDFFMRCRRNGVTMQIQGDIQVSVDTRRSTSAGRPYDQDWRAFHGSLTARRSHRNLSAIRAFFRRNYPIRSLHFIGSSLYLLRYSVVWGLSRMTRLLRRSHTL